jgi:hypothetical protein
MTLQFLYWAWIVTSCYLVFRGTAIYDFNIFLAGTLVFCIGGFIFQTVNQWIARKVAAAATKEIKHEEE